MSNRITTGMKREEVFAYYGERVHEASVSADEALSKRRALITEAYRSGLTKKAIAIAAGLSEATVRSMLITAGEA